MESAVPTMSLYSFQRSDPSLAGPFSQNNVTYPDGAWAFADVSGIGFNPNTSALAWERLDSEIVIDLSAAANSPTALATINQILTSPASLTGPVRTSYVAWQNVPSKVSSSNPNSHQPTDLLATINLDFEITTPWYCSNASGTITYYVFFSLDSGGNLNGTVQAWYYNYSGGHPFCTGNISSTLNNAVPAAMPQLQTLLNAAIALNSGSNTFWMLYFLPGHGLTSGFIQDNADDNAALALLPN
jgi:hypothetical protein